MTDNDEPDVVFVCGFEPYHEHSFPADWQFGGSNGLDPRTDPRYQPTTYTYFDDKLKVVHFTQAPLCDDEALDNFTKVAGFGPEYNPVWITARRPGERNPETLPFTYDRETDEVRDKE